MLRLFTLSFFVLFVYTGSICLAQQTNLPPHTDTAQARPQHRDTIISNNGLHGNLAAHDPCMIKAGDTYYVLTTGMSLKSSKDMVNWHNEGSLLGKETNFSWWNNDIPGKVSLWAPDIHYADGLYRLYYSVSAWMNFKSSVGYATNVTLDKHNPAYKWQDRGQVIGYKNGGQNVNCIDPNFFADEDGRQYLIYGSFKGGLRLVELNPKTGKPFTDTPKLTIITTNLGEGSFIIKGPQYYYIFASRGRCCAGLQSSYQIVIGRAKKITGPYLTKEGKSWVDNNYTVFLAGNYDEPGRGHNGFFAEGDTTYIVYHAYTRAFNGQSLLNIKPMYMDKDGWPSLDPHDQLFKMPAFEQRLFVGNQ